jgi:hypothetical protein
VEFYNAVLGTMALMGKDMRVRLRSPVINFFPTILIISFPIDRILFTWDLSEQIFPPLLWAYSCRGSSSLGKNLS